MMWSLIITACITATECETQHIRPIPERIDCLHLRNAIRRDWWDRGVDDVSAACVPGLFV